MNAAGADGGQGRQPAPHVALARHLRRRPCLARLHLDDDLRRAGEQDFRRGLNALALDVGKDVVTPRGLEHVVHKTDAPTRVDVAQGAALAVEHEHRSGAGFALDLRAHLVDLSIDARRQCARVARVIDPIAEGANGGREVRKPCVLVLVHRQARAAETRDQIRLRTVHDDKIGLERQNPLEVRIEERADLWQCADFRRVGVKTRDADHVLAGADRKEHLGHGRDEGNDTNWGRSTQRP